MVYIYLPAPYYHLNLDVTKENLLAAGFSAVPAVFLVYMATTQYITNMLNDRCVSLTGQLGKQVSNKQVFLGVN